MYPMNFESRFSLPSERRMGDDVRRFLKDEGFDP